MKKFYTGVGSRITPSDVLKFMEFISSKLSGLYILRSGGADGADRSFEIGVGINGECEIYKAEHATKKSMEIAKKYHNAWDKLSQYGKELHGRNAFQILGMDLKTPSSFLICWTPDGCYKHKDRSIKTGGTGTAISISSENNIPIYNLYRPDHIYKLCIYIDTEERKERK